MKDAGITNYYEQKPLEGDKPEQLVLLLHGLGADGRDLIGLAPYFAQKLPRALFISPDAPFPCDMAPIGRQWFSLQQRDYASMLAGVKMAAPILDSFITEILQKHNLPASKLALAGFSQGTMMSLYTGPRHKDPIAGILGYSGALLWEEEIDFKLNKIPVHLVHGEADEVVPFAAYGYARDTLKKAGFAVSGQSAPGLGHGIDPEGIESGAKFLAPCFNL